MHRDAKTLAKAQTIGMQHLKAVKTSATIFQMFLLKSTFYKP